nr:hypothetical protein [Flavobacteriales bacterium]
IDRESAFEILEAKLKQAAKEEEKPEPEVERRRPKKEEPSVLEDLSKNTMVRQVGRTVFRELTRGLLGVLGVKAVRSRRAKR